MKKLKIHEIINNMVDELLRARDILANNEEAESSMLISDIDAELDRAFDLKERIDFAMLMAAEKRDVAIPTIYKIYNLESITDLPYENGLVDTETVYNTISEITSGIESETKDMLLYNAIIAWYGDSLEEYHGFDDKEFINRVCDRTGMTEDEYTKLMFCN